MSPGRGAYWASVAVVAVIYCASAALGFSMALDAPQVTLVWPAAGIALAATLLLGWRTWPGVALGAFLSNAFLVHEPVLTAAGIAAGNTAEVLAASWLLRRVVGFDPALLRIKDVAGLVFAIACGVTIAATVGPLSLCLGGEHPWDRFFALWWTWWLGDGIGALVIAPVLLVWTCTSAYALRPRQLFEAFALSALLVTVGHLAYGAPSAGVRYPLEYTVFPFLIWAALRFGQRGTTVVVIIVATTTVWASFHEMSRVTPQAMSHRLALTQLFLGVMTTTGLCLGAAIAERNRSADRVRTDDRVARVLAGSPSLAAAAPQILAAVGETLQWDFGAVWRIDPEIDRMRCIETWRAAGRDAPNFTSETRARSFELGVGLPGRVWRTGRPAWIAEVAKDAFFTRGEAAVGERLHSAFAFPLTLGDEVFGVMEFFCGEIRPPDRQLLAMARAIGAQIGQFIERNEVESRLIRSERELSDFFENAAVALHWSSEEGVILRANQTELALLGYARDEYVGHDVAEFHVDREIIVGMMDRLRAGQEIRNEEARMRCRDGSVRIVSISSNVLWENGRFVHTRCFTRDVTERKLAVAALAESEERFRFLAETIPSLVWTTAPDGTVLYLNRRWIEYTGLPQQEIANRLMDIVVHPDDRDRCLAQWSRALREGLPYEIEVRHRRFDGSFRWFLSRALPRRDDAGRVVSWFGVTTDIHDQKLMQERLFEADRRKDEFLAILAHELRNPLAPLSNALQLLRIGGDDASRTDPLALAERQLDYLVRLVDDLLDVSRITRGKIQLRLSRVTLADVVARAVETSRPLLDQCNQSLEVRLPEEPVWLEADPTRIAQVLGNLLNNAAKYGKPSDRVQLTATLSRGQNGTPAEVLISVRDYGIGIPGHMLPQIFDPFVQADRSLDRSHGGIGIGLALVKSLVELHGGSVGAKSDGPGKGSEFFVRLPVASPPALESRPAPAPVSAHEPEAAARRRVLVIDDNPDSALTMSLLLKRMGNEVETGSDGVEAVERAESFAPEIVLLDIGLPRMNGYEAARRIREAPWGQSMTLVALTGWGQDEDRRRSKEAGFDHHLVKPVSRAVLEDLLAKIGSRDAE